MKKFLLIGLMVIFCSLLKAQIKLEHIYCHNDGQSISLVNLGDSVYNYLLLDFSITPQRYTLYQMNHSVNISDTFPIRSTSDYPISLRFFSRSLFDCDTSNIEFLLIRFSNPSYKSSCVSVYRTNGTILLHRDSTMMYLTSIW